MRDEVIPDEDGSGDRVGAFAALAFIGLAVLVLMGFLVYIVVVRDAAPETPVSPPAASTPANLPGTPPMGMPPQGMPPQAFDPARLPPGMKVPAGVQFQPGGQMPVGQQFPPGVPVPPGVPIPQGFQPPAPLPGRPIEKPAMKEKPRGEAKPAAPDGK